MNQTLRTRQEGTAWQKRHNRHAPRFGDIAPDFELRDVDGLHPVRLSDFRGVKPTALVFGSFT